MGFASANMCVKTELVDSYHDHHHPHLYPCMAISIVHQSSLAAPCAHIWEHAFKFISSICLCCAVCKAWIYIIAKLPLLVTLLTSMVLQVLLGSSQG